MLKNKIDGTVFTTEQEAFEHFKLNYMETNYKEDSFDDVSMVEKLKAAFPEASVKVTVGDDWGDYRVVLTLENATYDDYIGKDYDSIRSVDDFINTYKTVNGYVQYILKQVNELYCFEDFKFENFNTDYGNGYYINFTHEFGRDTYQGHNVEKFIKSLSQYFVNVIEGVIEEIRDDGYFEGYSIGGIPLNGLLRRADTVRFEILE